MISVMISRGLNLDDILKLEKEPEDDTTVQVSRNP